MREWVNKKRELEESWRCGAVSVRRVRGDEVRGEHGYMTSSISDSHIAASAAGDSFGELTPPSLCRSPFLPALLFLLPLWNDCWSFWCSVAWNASRYVSNMCLSSPVCVSEMCPRLVHRCVCLCLKLTCWFCITCCFCIGRWNALGLLTWVRHCRNAIYYYYLRFKKKKNLEGRLRTFESLPRMLLDFPFPWHPPSCFSSSVVLFVILLMVYFPDSQKILQCFSLRNWIFPMWLMLSS